MRSETENYIQNNFDSIAVPGALGLGQSAATSITNAFYFFSFLAPIPFAIVSDVWLGRYKTLLISLLCVFPCPCQQHLNTMSRVAYWRTAWVFLGV